jgi:hypothetical protein
MSFPPFWDRIATEQRATITSPMRGAGTHDRPWRYLFVILLSGNSTCDDGSACPHDLCTAQRLNFPGITQVAQKATVSLHYSSLFPRIYYAIAEKNLNHDGQRISRNGRIHEKLPPKKQVRFTCRSGRSCRKHIPEHAVESEKAGQPCYTHQALR